jgi:hypothetical protein
MGRRFEKALAAKGYQIIHDASQADIIVTHSAGCLLLPKKVRAKQIIQLGPYWPEHLWFAAAWRKITDDMRTHHKASDLGFWLDKCMWNFVYLLRLPTNFRFAQGIKHGSHWRHGHITTVVRARFDPFCEQWPKSQSFETSPTYLSFPGNHDDCWRKPAPYIALIKS